MCLNGPIYPRYCTGGFWEDAVVYLVAWTAGLCEQWEVTKRRRLLCGQLEAAFDSLQDKRRVVYSLLRSPSRAYG